MSTYKRGLDMAAALIERNVEATCDPRSAVPPCVLIEPPAVRYDTGCSATADWTLLALAPATGNADAWSLLDAIADVVADVLPVEAHAFVAYQSSPDSPPVPAYRFTFTQGVDLA